MAENDCMTTPAWMPPQLPEVVTPEPEPPRQGIAIVAVALACLLAFGLGAAGWKVHTAVEPAPQTARPLRIVDELLNEMISGQWEPAFQRFSGECSDFEPDALRAGFEPVLATYQSHELDPLRRSDFDPDEIVLVFGEIDLGNTRPNPIRAEFVFVGVDAERPWSLCGLRIDEP